MSWMKFHRWAGLIVSAFLLLFCFSGIILNHRDVVAGAQISRSLLPASYRIKDYNNGIIRGTTKIGTDSILAFGACGVWLTDESFGNVTDFNTGLPNGVDRRNVRNIVTTSSGDTWCATQFGLYRLAHAGWTRVEIPGNSERISDITASPDRGGVVIVTRSRLYTVSAAGGNITAHTLPAPEHGQNEISLFKTIWHLHSGDLFGLTGKIIVDIIALILGFLSLTGIVLFLLPYNLKRRKRISGTGHRNSGTDIRIYKWNFKWHDSIGYLTVALTGVVVFTGMCLRPPLMIPFVMVRTSPLYGSAFDNDNHWHDRLRSLRWDAESAKWLLSTSDGFYTFADFNDVPVAIPAAKSPAVSPMGINVFINESPGIWIIGSFSGIYRWNVSEGLCYDYYDNEPIDRRTSRSYGIGNAMVCGYSMDTPDPVVFDYSRGTSQLPPMDPILAQQPMSLWNFALELHVGRCYSPFLGPLSDMFVFIAGSIIFTVIVSGYVISRRRKKNSHNVNQ